jgi:hypothetical protein
LYKLPILIRKEHCSPSKDKPIKNILKIMAKERFVERSEMVDSFPTNPRPRTYEHTSRLCKLKGFISNTKLNRCNLGLYLKWRGRDLNPRPGAL